VYKISLTSLFGQTIWKLNAQALDFALSHQPHYPVSAQSDFLCKG